MHGKMFWSLVELSSSQHASRHFLRSFFMENVSTLLFTLQAEVVGQWAGNRLIVDATKSHMLHSTFNASYSRSNPTVISNDIA